MLDLSSDHLILLILVSLLLLVLALRYAYDSLMRKRKERHRVTFGPSKIFSIALVICEQPPNYYQDALLSWMEKASKAENIKIYSSVPPTNSIPISPLSEFFSCRCEAALVVTWSLDLQKGWDEKALTEFRRNYGRNKILSHYVQGNRRIEAEWKSIRCLQSPLFYDTSSQTSHIVPDFRLILSEPSHINKILQAYFTNFWMGPLALALSGCFCQQCQTVLAIDTRLDIGMEHTIYLDNDAYAVLLTWLVDTRVSNEYMSNFQTLILHHKAFDTLQIHLPRERNILRKE